MLLLFCCLLLSLSKFASAGNCCDRSRSGFMEFTSLASYLHDPQIIETHFTYNNVTDIYSIDKKSTLEFNKNHYFLDDFYEPFENRTKVCVYKLYRHFEELEHMIFDDGSRPRQIVFGCHYNQECCEVGCCEINKYIYFWFIYPCAAIMIVMACTARRKREREARLRHIRNAMHES